MISGLAMLLYGLSFNVIVQMISGLFSVFATLTSNLFVQIVLLSFSVSLLSVWIELKVKKGLEMSPLFQRFVQHREQIERLFQGKVRMIYMLGLIKVFRHGMVFEFLRNLSLVFKVFLFIPAYVFLNESVPRLFRETPAFISGLDPFMPDQLLNGVNVLPFVMFVISVLSGVIFFHESRRHLLKLISMSALFLVMLYGAKSVLVVYWCCNITFSSTIFWVWTKKAAVKAT